MGALGNLRRALRARGAVFPILRSQINPPMTDPKLDTPVAEVQVRGGVNKKFTSIFFGRGYRPILANRAKKETQSKNQYEVPAPLSNFLTPQSVT